MQGVFSLLFPWFNWLLGFGEGQSMLAEPVAPADDEPEDVLCLTRAAAGDERAWQELFDRWKRPLLAFFYRSLGPMSESGGRERAKSSAWRHVSLR